MEASVEADPLKRVIAWQRDGDLCKAEKGWRDLLSTNPEDPTALHFFGLLRLQQGRSLEGLEMMHLATRLDPEYVDAWSNLSIAFYRQRDLDRAERCCRKALELRPDFSNAWGNLGMILRAKECYEESLQAMSRALELEPDMRSTAISYAQLLYRMNRIPDARAFYARWSETHPGDAMASHMLAAMSGADPPARAADGYVRDVFDDFADSFDERLKGLEYDAPALVHAAVGRHAPNDNASLLDLGCGTGLCGPLFRSEVRRIVGVDISSKMLAKAAARGCYDQLNLGELTEFLNKCSEQFDIVLAADVLCYFGELDQGLSGVRRVLSRQGRLAFTLEASEAGGESLPFKLHSHGRYSHDRDALRASLTRCGLRILELSEATLRLERGKPVRGHLSVVCQA